MRNRQQRYSKSVLLNLSIIISINYHVSIQLERVSTAPISCHRFVLSYFVSSCESGQFECILRGSFYGNKNGFFFRMHWAFERPSHRGPFHLNYLLNDGKSIRIAANKSKQLIAITFLFIAVRTVHYFAFRSLWMLIAPWRCDVTQMEFVVRVTASIYFIILIRACFHSVDNFINTLKLFALLDVKKKSRVKLQRECNTTISEHHSHLNVLNRICYVFYIPNVNEWNSAPLQN